MPKDEIDVLIDFLVDELGAQNAHKLIHALHARIHHDKGFRNAMDSLLHRVAK